MSEQNHTIVKSDEKFDHCFSEEDKRKIFTILQVDDENNNVEIKLLKARIYELKLTFDNDANVLSYPAPSKVKHKIEQFHKRTESYLNILADSFPTVLKEEESYSGQKYLNLFSTQLGGRAEREMFKELLQRVYTDLSTLDSIITGTAFDSVIKGKENRSDPNIWNLLCFIGNIYFERTNKKPMSTEVKDSYTDKREHRGEIIELTMLILNGLNMNKLSPSQIHTYFQKLNKQEKDFGLIEEPLWCILPKKTS